MSRFLELVSQGNIEEFKNIYDLDQEVAYTKDANNHNALAIAVLSGQWKAAIVLLKYCRVSPHMIDANGESIFHLIPRGLKVKRPIDQDYEDIRAENMAYWRSEEQKELARIEEIHKQNPDLKPPINLIVKKPKTLEAELFGNLDLFLPKFLLLKYHVVLTRVNSQGINPASLANQLNERELAEYYDEQMKPHMIRRRIVAGLNENLVRDIGSYL